MRINRCIGCENEIVNYPCPHCGFDIAEYSQPECALPWNTILHGRYLIGKVLGQGGFGITYIAWDMALEVKVAIKEYFPHGHVTRSTADTSLSWYTTAQARELKQSGMETFLKEARKMAKVEKIPEVVRVRDTFAENATAYIVMDFIEGQTLKSRLEKKGILSWEEARKIFFPVISALVQVHNSGIIHRDLSPDNLMLTPDGGVFILDLGAAKDLSVNGGLSSMQVAKSGFSPPEQYAERGGTGPWSDVYALAATMYYSITGVVPPTSLDRLLAGASVQWDLPQLEALPKPVVEALKKAMTVVAKERTQSMGELLVQMQKPTKKQKQDVSPKTQTKVSPTQTYPNQKKTESQTRKQKNHLPAWIGIVTAAAAAVIICLISGVHIHRWEPATCEAPQTCFTCGKVKGEPLNHQWLDATCEAPQTCALCEKTKGTALGHTLLAATCQEASRCSVCGETEGAFAPHTWQEATCLAPKTCSVCGKTKGTAKLHIWQPATYAVPERCSSCGTMRGHALAKPIDGGNDLAVGLKENGTVIVAGYNYLGPTIHEVTKQKVSTWRDIVAVETDSEYVIGLKKDGTVLSAGSQIVVTNMHYNNYQYMNLTFWKDVVAIDAGNGGAVGLKSDGTVIADGPYYGNVDVSDWKDIVAISTSGRHVVGLRSDGTVVASGDNKNKECDVSSWTDIVAIATGSGFTLGLKSDGTVLFRGKGDNRGEDLVTGWNNIIDISAGRSHSVGLKSDGTVIAVGDNSYGQCDVSSWSNIVAIGVGGRCTFGLKADGNVVAAGYDDRGDPNFNLLCELKMIK